MNGIAFNQQYNTFATYGSDGAIIVWNKDTKSKYKSSKKFPSPFTAASFTEDGKLLAYAIGYPDPVSPAESWCRNQRMARVLAEDMGIPYLCFLQPVQGDGPYPMTAEERAFFETKAAVVLKAIDKPYGQCVTEFYDEVRAILAADPDRHDHVIDITDAFAGTPGAYRDHRHQGPEGVARLAEVIAGHLAPLLPPPTVPA